MKDYIINQIRESIEPKERILNNEAYIKQIEDISNSIVDMYKRGNKLLLCGNGGSAADAQHIAGEMVCRFKLNRRGLPAIAFNCDSSTVTAIGNDFGYDIVFEKQVEAFGKEGDILLAISTSGNSKNVTNALKKARELGVQTILLTGKDGGENREFADTSFIVPSNDTPRIQETHILVYHIICDIVERSLFGDEIVK